ncbi:hypothetical protein [Streptomyces sp. NPDC020681]|uniref:hypothetical protein n=1 Tax=Streptomyces sp. NPDC020681 TaxID=3365083 RepID=UPI00378D5383
MTTTEQQALRADCVAGADGALAFTVAGQQAPLVLKRRGADDEWRLPLTVSDDGTARAELPADAELAEGHWDIRTDQDDAVDAGVRDLRTIIGRVPATGRPVAARIPYATPEGRLAVRSWLRMPHAEAGDIGCAPGRSTMTVEGVLYGAELAESAVAEARLRGTDRVHRLEVTREGPAFAFTVAYESLIEQPVPKEQWWDLWLLPAEDAAGTRIARILDDVWDKKVIFSYPPLLTDTFRAIPCYTGDNELSVRVTAVARKTP